MQKFEILEITERQDSLGDRLRVWRESMGLSVEDIAREIKTSSHYIYALEEGRYDVFLAKVYAVGFLKQIVTHFNLDEQESLLTMMRNEWDARGKKDDNPYVYREVNKKGWQKWHLTSRRLFGAIGTILLLYFFWFLGIQLIAFTASPQLQLEEPKDGAMVDVPLIMIKGKVDRESQLTVNGRHITLNQSGFFNQDIELVAGVNALHFLVQNRFGKIAAETRYVVVE